MEASSTLDQPQYQRLENFFLIFGEEIQNEKIDFTLDVKQGLNKPVASLS